MLPHGKRAERDQQGGQQRPERQPERERRAERRRGMGEQHDARQPAGGIEHKSKLGSVPQARAKTKVPLVPPKPNELDMATRIGILRAELAT